MANRTGYMIQKKFTRLVRVSENLLPCPYDFCGLHLDIKDSDNPYILKYGVLSIAHYSVKDYSYIHLQLRDGDDWYVEAFEAYSDANWEKFYNFYISFDGTNEKHMTQLRELDNKRYKVTAKSV